MDNRELRAIWQDIRAAARSGRGTSVDQRLPDLLRERYLRDEVHLTEASMEAGLGALLKEAREGVAPDSRSNGKAHHDAPDTIDLRVPRPEVQPQIRRRPIWVVAAVAACLAVVLVILGILRSPKAPEPVVREAPRQAAPPKGLIPGRNERLTPGVTVEKTPKPDRERRPIRTAERPPVSSPLAVIGTVASAMGEPLVRQPGGMAPILAKSGTKIGYGSRIETGDIDKVVLRFSDGTRIALDFNTILIIDPSERGFGRPRELRLLSGSLVASVVHSEKEGPFRIVTSPATAEVVGTMFSLALEGSRTKLQVREGAVSFYNEHGRVLASSNTESVAAEGAAPSQPKRITSFLWHPPGSDVTYTVQNTPPDVKEARSMMATGSPSVNALTREALGGRRAATRAGLRDILAKSPDAAATNNLGVLDDMDDRLGDAVRGYQAAVRLDPKSALYRSNLGRGLRLAGNSSRAIEEIRKAAELDRKGWQRLDDLAAMLDGEGQAEEALKIIDEALRRNPQAVEAWLTKSQILADLGRTQESVEAARRMLALEPNKPHAWESLAQAIGPGPEAEALLKHALQLDPDHAPSLNTYGSTLYRTNRLAEAETVLRHLTQVSPKLVAGWDNLTITLVRLGRPAEAVETAKKAITLDPRDTFAHLNLTTALATLGKFEEAEVHARKAVALSPELPNTHNTLGSTLASRGKDAEAIVELKKAIEIDPAFLGAHQTLGNVYELDKQYSLAEAEYRKVIALAPKIWWGYGNLSRMLLSQKKPAEAEIVLRRFIEIAPAFIPPHSRLAQALADQGRTDEAEAELRKVLELAGADKAAKVAAFGQLGALYERKGDKPAAVAAYNNVLELDPANQAALDALKRLGG